MPIKAHNITTEDCDLTNLDQPMSTQGLRIRFSVLSSNSSLPTSPPKFLSQFFFEDYYHAYGDMEKELYLMIIQP